MNICDTTTQPENLNMLMNCVYLLFFLDPILLTPDPPPPFPAGAATLTTVVLIVFLFLFLFFLYSLFTYFSSPPSLLLPSPFPFFLSLYKSNVILVLVIRLCLRSSISLYNYWHYICFLFCEMTLYAFHIFSPFVCGCFLTDL